MGMRFLKLFDLYFSLEIQKADSRIRNNIESGSFYVKILQNAMKQ
jgi:hypothetical protein